MATFLLDTSIIIDAINDKKNRRHFLYGKKGRTLNLGDVLIAATALDNSLVLLTDNVKDIPMDNLSLYPLPK